MCVCIYIYIYIYVCIYIHIYIHTYILHTHRSESPSEQSVSAVKSPNDRSYTHTRSPQPSPLRSIAREQASIPAVLPGTIIPHQKPGTPIRAVHGTSTRRDPDSSPSVSSDSNARGAIGSPVRVPQHVGAGSQAQGSARNLNAVGEVGTTGTLRRSGSSNNL